MPYAHITDGIVDMVVGDPHVIFAKSYADEFVQCPDGVMPGWRYDGAWSAPAAPPIAVPQSVTMRQARLALRKAGKYALVAPAIAALPSPQKEDAEIEWEFSSVVERNRPFVVQLGMALGLDSAAMDALFIAAEKL